ncbi:PAS domain S-box protein [Maridesulfovibrio sp.]|uniref:PAS domain S-box protein n=1 Tax=Maridesulfovibrio sp. TaxID=2795000 RepID=UPI0039EEE476
MRSLYLILLRSYIVLALVPLVLLGTMLIVLIGNGQIEASFRHEQSKARDVAYELKHQFSVLEGNLYNLNQYRNFITLSDSETQNVAKELVAKQSEICSIMMLDSTGKIKANVSSSTLYGKSDHLHPSYESLFKKVISSGDVSYGRVHTGSNSGGMLLQVGVPLVDRETGSVGVVVLAEFRLGMAWRNVVKRAAQQEESIYLIGDSGKILAHPNPSLVLAQKKFSETDDGEIRKNFIGEYVISASSELGMGDLKFTIIAEKLALAALEPAMRSAGLALVATLITVGLVLIATLRTTRRITRPVKLLTEAVLNIKDYGFYPGISIHDFAEIEALSQAFDSMTRNLQRMLEELRHEVQIRQESELALSMSEERFRAMFEFNSVVMLLIDPDNGRILEANNAASRYYGWPVEEMTSMSLSDITLERPEELHERMKEVMHHRANRFELKHVLSDGSVREVDECTGPIPMGGKDVIFSSVIDITQRKIVEQELHDSEERFRALHNSSFGGIAIHDDGRILDCNQGLSDISGYDLNELQGMDILKLIADVSRDEVERDILGGVERDHRVNCIRKEGTEYPARLESRNIPYKGRVVQVTELRDITSEKLAEEFIIQNEKMMSLGGLAAGMAHEINNPLAAIVGSCQNLQTRLFRDTPINRKAAEESGTSFESIARYLEIRDCERIINSIYESGKRAADIIKDMLSFSRRNEKSLVYNKVQELMDTTIKLVSNDYDLKKNYDFKKIEIVRDYDESSGNVICYGNQIQQVFFNLLKNAAHAMAEKDFTNAEPRIVVRNYTLNGQNITEVEDNGPGLSEEARQKVFEPFFSTKSPGKGTGLGLSVSYFIIVKQHEGSMEVFSEPGEWTRFVISLPVKGPQYSGGVGTV